MRVVRVGARRTGGLRDKLSMTYALEAESERADVCKNTQGAEGRLRG